MTYDWQTTFGHAISKFGDTPGPQLEQHIRDTFTTHPQAVTNAIEKIIDAHQAGRVRSPWGALRTEIDQQIRREAIVDDRTDARRYITAAEQWIRNAGLHSTWPECLDELRGRPKLSPSLNPAIETRLEALWAELQPVARTIEAEEHARAQRWIHNRAAVNQAPKVAA